MRNHNPLNIRRDGRTRWIGQTATQKDREFVQFHSDLFGFRAAFRILRSYLGVHGLCTLEQVIFRWAPPEDGNDTRSYVETVSRRSGVRAKALLQWGDREKVLAVVAAMAWVESRMESVDEETLERAYEMAK